MLLWPGNRELRDCESDRCCGDGETSGEGEPAAKDLCGLRQTLRLAQEVGEGLGRGQVLFGKVPEAAEVISPCGPVEGMFRRRLSLGLGQAGP